MVEGARTQRLARFGWLSLLAGAVMFSIGLVFHIGLPVVAPSIDAQYETAGVFRDFPGAVEVYMAIHPWLYAPLFTAVFLFLGELVGRERFRGARTGLLYGLTVFSVGSLPIFALCFASILMPVGIVLCWMMQNLCQYAAAGACLGWCERRDPGESRHTLD